MRNFARFFSAISALSGILILSLLGCSPPKLKDHVTKEEPKKLSILATTGMVADIAKNIGKEFVQVNTLMGAGVDPHLYKASIQDVQKLNQADLILYTGLHLEGKMTDILDKFARKKKSIALSSGIPKNLLIKTDPESDTYDPHIWMDVKLWSDTIAPVLKAICELDPKHQQIFRDNASKYRKKLLQLNETCLKKIYQIPKKRRILITAHDAFHYFGRAYDIEVWGIQGVSTESEAGLKEVNNLVNLIVKRNIKAIFVESSVSSKNIEALLEGARHHGAKLRIGGSLFSDAMGSQKTFEGTYIGMITHNINTIFEGLK